MDLTPDQLKFLIIFFLVVMGWLFSKIPLYITGLIGVCLTAMLQIESAKNLFSYFSNPIVYLFMGGFIFAQAMNEHGLDKRFSLMILSKKFIAGSFNRMILAFLIITAFFSMWVSNTATCAMMLPIVVGTLTSLKIKDQRITSLVLLGLAYSASIGGLGTPIGSTPNIIAIGMLKDLAGIDVSFFTWMKYGIPFVFIFVAILYFYIIYSLPDRKIKFDNIFIRNEYKALPKTSKHEKHTLYLFIALIFCWFLPSILGTLLGAKHELSVLLKASFNGGISAMFFASLLFIFPLGDKKKILIAADIKKIDWPSLLLFGTGLALGKTLFSTGLAKIAGDFVVNNFAHGSFFILLTVLIYATIFATELASNTATANILLPIVIAMGISMGTSPIIMSAAVAFSCSLAFMLPVATPPNAIVYGSNLVSMKEMMRAGLFLNIVCGLVMILIFYFL